MKKAVKQGRRCGNSLLGMDWEKIQRANPFWFQMLTFADGITFDVGKFRTTKVRVVFEVLSTNLEKEDCLVVPRGIEPRLPG